MSGVLRLANTGGSNGRSTIVAAASSDATFTLPSAGGTILTTDFDTVGDITWNGSNINITNADLNVNSGQLFVDESTGFVGIGTETPTADLHVKGPNFVTLNLETTGGSTNQLIFSRSNGGAATTEAIVGHATGSNDFYFQNQLSGDIVFGTNATEQARIDTLGNLLVGTDTSINNIRLQQKVAVVATGDGAYSGIGMTSYNGSGNTNAASFLDFQRSRGTTDGSLVALADNDTLGYIVFRGASNTGFLNCANITSEVDGALTNSSSPGRIRLSTTPAGAVFPIERMRIDSDGNVGLGIAGPATKLHLLQSGDDCEIRFNAGVGYRSVIGAEGSNILAFETGYNEHARIDSSGRLLVGTSSSFDVDGTFQHIGAYSQFFKFGAANHQVIIGSANGTQGSPTSLADDDTIGRIVFRGRGASNYLNGAFIAATVDGTPDAPSNDLPTRLVFSTTADGNSSPTERLRIESDGDISNHKGAGGYGIRLVRSSSSGAAIQFESSVANLGQIATEASYMKFGTSQANGWSFDQYSNANPPVFTAQRVRIQLANGQIESNQTSIIALTSERRTKNNIVAIDPEVSWETIKTVPFYSYNYKNSPDVTSYGAIVDEVPSDLIVQRTVSDQEGNQVPYVDEEGPLRTYDNGLLQARLYTALQTALSRIEALESEVSKLRSN